jgi:Rrf2 family cysteine metabolism transcriptional repressor
MITVSEKSRLALSALVELGRRATGAPVPIVEVAGARDIPLHVVEQLFGALRRAGILQSQRGVRGGYSFRRPADEVTALDVVQAVDGELGVAEPAGPLDAFWLEVAGATAQPLADATIADLVQREALAGDAPMFHI